MTKITKQEKNIDSDLKKAPDNVKFVEGIMYELKLLKRF